MREKGWKGKKNGELLSLMIDESFEALITFDKSFQHQQNFEKFPLPVLVLIAPDNTYLTSKDFVPIIDKKLSENLKPGVHLLTKLE